MMKENESSRQGELSREATLEAVLFAAGNPLPLAGIAAVMDCEESEVVELARSLQAKLTSEVTDRHLSAPTMETLSIIAFKQPITKPEIEQLRGVRVERALAKLLELGLICELGRKQVIGRPILYGTTATFLRCFGLDSLDDLPQLPAEDPAVRLELEAEAAGQSGKADSAAEKDSPAEDSAKT